MIEYIYIPIILLLYWRTWKYNVLIDDPVKRDGYMYIITTKRCNPEVYEKRRSIIATITNIGVFMSIGLYLHYMFGWKVAVLYAVFPLNVCGVAWTTGNYYMSTVLLILSTHFLLVVGGPIAIGLGLLMYGAALNSTLSSIPYIVIALLQPYGVTLLIPLLCFLFGKRMRTGLKLRKEAHDNIQTEAGRFKLYNLLNIPKTICYYIMLSIFPIKLGFFHSFGRNRWYFTHWFLALSGIVCLLFGNIMLYIDWQLCLWWFIFIGLFSQYIIYGQFTAERYTLLANVAFCIAFSIILPETIYPVLATLWFCRSWNYIPAWKHNVDLFSHSICGQPESPENYTNLASYYLDSKQYFDAIKPLLHAEQLTEGRKFGIYINLAQCYIAMGERGDIPCLQKGYIYSQKALEDCPEDKKEGITRQMYRVNNLIIDYNKKRKKAFKRR